MDRCSPHNLTLSLLPWYRLQFICPLVMATRTHLPLTLHLLSYLRPHRRCRTLKLLGSQLLPSTLVFGKEA